MCVHPDLTDRVDTSYNGPCTDVNADVSQSYNTIETPTYHSAHKLVVKRPLHK